MGSISGSTEKPTRVIRVDRELTVVPAHPSAIRHINLSSFDVYLLPIHYDQRGLLFEMPSYSYPSAIDRLEKSLSQVLVHFYPLAGRLSTSPIDGEVFIDCNDFGAAFTEASADHLTVEDLMAVDVPAVVYELFPLGAAANIEGHRLPLLAVQVTKLRDGIFLACSVNHVIVDGCSLWNFFNSWAELCGGSETISVQPNHNRWRSPVRLGLDPDAGERFIAPFLKARIFHFTKEVLKRLKDRACRESVEAPVSSLQALCGHVWQAITRARQLDPEETTYFQLAIECRGRLVPPLAPSYFGNVIQTINVTTTVREVAGKGISFPAQLLSGLIKGHGDEAIRAKMGLWEKDPKALSLEEISSTKNVVVLGSSPRFRMYENDFGWGRPVAVRSGRGNKMDGKVQSYPGRNGGGSVDLEICLVPHVLEALLSDQHFIDPLP